MKSILTMVFLIVCFVTYSQNIQFNVIESVAYVFQSSDKTDYVPLKNPITVTFTPDSLTMVHKSGKAFWRTAVVSFDTKTKEEYGEVKEYNFIIETKFRNKYTGYVLIQKKWIVDSWIYEITFPGFSVLGEITAVYSYRSDFTNQ